MTALSGSWRRDGAGRDKDAAWWLGLAQLHDAPREGGRGAPAPAQDLAPALEKSKQPPAAGPSAVPWVLLGFLARHTHTHTHVCAHTRAL